MSGVRGRERGRETTDPLPRGKGQYRRSSVCQVGGGGGGGGRSHMSRHVNGAVCHARGGAELTSTVAIYGQSQRPAAGGGAALVGAG